MSYQFLLGQMKNWVLEIILCLSIEVHKDSQVIWKPWGKTESNYIS